jgi:hypothetical protein
MNANNFTKLLVLFLIVILSAFSKEKEGKVVINQDPSIGRIVEKHIAINEKHSKVDGYRLQIFSVSGANSKDRANLMKAEFLTKYPNAQVYIVYHAPTFKVRIGNYRTKLEALKFMQEIKNDYPFAFVAVDKIELLP